MSAPPPRPSPASLAGLVLLGLAAALWSLWLWAALWQSRSGVSGGCPLGGGEACSALWDGAFASGVQRLSGLPVAAWGLVWGLAALALPLEALRRRADQRDDAELISAIRLTAAGGLLAALALAAVALGARSFCPGCVISYGLAAGYAGIGVFSWKRFGLPARQRGAALAAGAVTAGFALLLIPALQTPLPAAVASRAAVASGDGSGAGGEGRALAELIESLEPRLRQALADSLAIYRGAEPVALPPPRALRGAPDAALRITEFTDVLCPHCAELYSSLDQIEALLPAGRLAVDARQFPLDADCNPLVQRAGEPVRCLAAKVRVCAESAARSHELARALFDAQQGLTEARVLEIAAGFLPRAELETCLAAPETERRLAEDIELAGRFQIDGTPLVVVNGRRATSFGPFLYAIALAQGHGEHPAFAALPAGRADAHLH